MAAMAPALTDTAAHSATFKLPASPANPGLESPYAPTSPDLPDQLLPRPKDNHISPLSPSQTSLSPTIHPVEGYMKAEIPDPNHRKNSNLDLLNGHSFFRLENLTKLMKEKDTRSVIEFLRGFNGNHKTDKNSADSRPKMNGTDREPSYKVSNTDVSSNVSLRIDSDCVNDLQLSNSPSLTDAKEKECSQSSDTSVLLSESRTSINSEDSRDTTDMVVDLESPSLQGSEYLNSSDSFEKDFLTSEENIVKTEEDIDTSECAPCASNFDEASSELVDLDAPLLQSVTSRQQSLKERNSRLLQRLRKLQLSQLGCHTKEEIGWFASEIGRDSVSLTGNGCTDCKQKQLQHSSHVVLIPCEKHVQSKSRTIKPAPLMTVSQRIIQRGAGKEVFRNIENVQKRLQRNLNHVQNAVDSEVTESSSDESDEDGDFHLTSHDGPTRGFHRLSLNKRAIWKWAAHRAGVGRRWTWLQAQVSDLEYRIRQHSDIYRQIKAAKGTVTLGTHPTTEEILRVQSLSRSGRKLSPVEAKIARSEKSKTVSPSSLSSVLSNVDHQSARLHQSLSNCLSSPLSLAGDKKTPPRPLNGYSVHGRPASGLSTVRHQQNHKLPANIAELTDSLAVTPEEQYCARTRPVRFYRKRRLVRPRDLYNYNPKAKRLSSVRCGCCPPSSCVMCGGRFNNLKPLNPISMPVGERLAHLDYGYHPVLSFPHDIPLPLHFESLLSKGENERRVKLLKRRIKPVLPQVKGKKRNVKRLRKLRQRNKLTPSNDTPPPTVGHAFIKHEPSPQVSSENRVKDEEQKVLTRSKSDSSSSLPSTPQPCNDATTSEEELRRCRTEVKRKRAQAYLEKKHRERSMSLPNIGMRPSSATPISNTPESKPPTPPLTSSLPSSTLQTMNKKKTGDAYDIDNIVIPYSMLASTRVEKLHYKEIDTPGWREVINGMLADLSHHLDECDSPLLQEEEGEEDLSDGEYIQRHLRYEITEKKKYLAILANQGSTAPLGGRRSRRTRNSSANSTPDPLSPNGSISEHTAQSQFDSPQSPSPLVQPNHNLNSTCPSNASEMVVARQLRSSSSEKRRISFGSDSQSSFDDSTSEVVQGWNRRTFPLSEEEVSEIDKCSLTTLNHQPLYTIRNQSPGSSVGVTPFESEDESSGSDNEMDDPNDPEWTVVSRRRQPKTETTTGEDSLVLHLAVKKEEPTEA